MNQDHLRLGLSFGGSIVLNALVLAPVAVVVFTATPSSALDVDTTMQAHVEPMPTDEIELGIDESDASTLTWVGYKDYMEHIARQAEFEQAQLQAAKGERASGEPLATPVTPPPTPEPTPPAPEQPPQEQPAEPAEPPAETPAETPAEPLESTAQAPPAEMPPETIGLPIDPASSHPGLPADIPGAPQPGRQPDEPGPDLPGETPDTPPDSTPAPKPADTPADTPADEPAEPTEPAQQTPPPQPTQPPATPNVTPSPTPTDATSEPDPSAPKGVKGVDDAPLRLDGSDRDSDATSLVKVTRRNLNLGRPLAREGLILYPRKPDFTSLQVVSSGGKRGILARLVFKNTGRMRGGRMLPAEAYIGQEVLSGPDKDTVRWSNNSLQFDPLQRSIHGALFSWAATGKRIDELQDDTPVIINLELQIAVR